MEKVKVDRDRGGGGHPNEGPPRRLHGVHANVDGDATANPLMRPSRCRTPTEVQFGVLASSVDLDIRRDYVAVSLGPTGCRLED